MSYEVRLAPLLSKGHLLKVQGEHPLYGRRWRLNGGHYCAAVGKSRARIFHSASQSEGSHLKCFGLGADGLLQLSPLCGYCCLVCCMCVLHALLMLPDVGLMLGCHLAQRSLCCLLLFLDNCSAGAHQCTDLVPRSLHQKKELRMGTWFW